jgi:hypothetical protein
MDNHDLKIRRLLAKRDCQGFVVSIGRSCVISVLKLQESLLIGLVLSGKFLSEEKRILRVFRTNGGIMTTRTPAFVIDGKRTRAAYMRFTDDNRVTLSVDELRKWDNYKSHLRVRRGTPGFIWTRFNVKRMSIRFIK